MIKIEQPPTVFQQVIITLETEEDVREFADIVRFAHINSNIGTAVDSASYKLAQSLESLGLYF